MEIEAQKSIQRKLEWKKQEEERIEEEKQLKARKQRKKLELDEFKKLIVSADRWNTVQQLRSYIEEVKKYSEKTNTLTDELKEWLSWAEQKVNWYDPLINAKDEWLSDEDKNSIFTQERTTVNEFFNHSPDTSYFPRPWYASRNR